MKLGILTLLVGLIGSFALGGCNSTTHPVHATVPSDSGKPINHMPAEIRNAIVQSQNQR